MSTFAGMVSARSRAKKFELFMRLMKPTEHDVVLDVGVDPGGYGDDLGVGTTNFFEAMYPWPQNIMALGTHDGAQFRQRHPEIRYFQGDGLHLPFALGTRFDIVFSNAVIEHVGGWGDQAQFAKEIRRVARKYFVTTPNRHFFVETHTRIPFVHWLPPAVADRIYTWMGKGWASGGRNFRLLDANQLQRLFPDGHIINLGMILVATNSST